MPLSRSAFALLVLGLLAPGLLPAQEPEPYLVRDINQSPAREKGLAAHEVLVTSGGLYYSFDDGIHGPELWRGEGPGASLVRDLCPGPCGSSPRYFAELDGKVYFFANDGFSGIELWRTDGSVGGTVLVCDLCPGPCGSCPATGFSLVVVGDALFFRASDSIGHVSLWTSDGTREGTRQVADICPRCGDNYFDLTAVGSSLFFRADDGEHGVELWSSDGVETALFRDDCPGPCSSGLAHHQPDLLTPSEHGLFYWQLVSISPRRWRLRAIDDDPFRLGHTIELDHPDPPHLAIVRSALFLSVSNRLARIDVPSFTLSLFRDFDQPVGPLTALRDFAVFQGYDPDHGFELWRTNGTDAGTLRVADTLPGPDSGAPENLVVMEGHLFFTARHGSEVWRSNGTTLGTRRFSSTVDPPSTITGLTPDPTRDSVLFTSGDLATQSLELWTANRSLSMFPARGIRMIPRSTGLGTLTPFGDTPSGATLFFGAREHPFELNRPWRSDGTERGTEMLSNLISNPEDAAPFRGGLIFRGGNVIWTTDGTVQGTHVLLRGFAADYLKVVGDRIWFSGQSPTEPGYELWSSDGTIAGTRLIKDIAPGSLPPQLGDGPRSSRPRQIMPVGSTLFFEASTPETGTEVWSTDGTTEGTDLHFDVCPGTCSSSVRFVTGFAGRLYLTSWNQTGLWSLRAGVRWGPLSSFETGRSFPDPVVFKDRLFFFAEDPEGREYLWSSDGTSPGTVRLQKVAEPAPSRLHHEPTLAGDRLYFTSRTEDAGHELWVSDGTAGGTSLLADIRPGPQGSAVHDLTAVGQHLFFSADDGTAGQELWRTDGTVAGTRRVGDILPGPGSAAPADLTPTGKHLFFSADDGTNGRELWALDITEPDPEPYTPCVPGADRLCLHGGRFEVSVGFRDPLAGGAVKPATAVPDSDQSGFFWFFAPGNLELVVKLLDGRASNGQFWVFFGALSDVEYTVTVTDRATGAVKTYHNPRGTFCGQADTAAFPEPAGSAAPTRSVRPAPALASAAATGACIPGPAALCLGGDRFRIEARWKDHGGVEGTATAVPRTGESGSFWFFSPGNTELVVKVLDGTGFNGKFWVFYGALSDVEYWLTVTDTVTGAAKTYHNPPGNYCGRGDTSAL